MSFFLRGSFPFVALCLVLGGGGEGRGREELPENWRSSVARKQGGGEAEEKQGGGWVKEEGVKGVRVFFSNFFLLFFILHLPEKNIS